MTFQEWCKEILPIVQAGADGEDIEYKQAFDREWSEKTSVDFYAASKYRIKPKTIKVNCFDVTEPVRSPLNKNDVYFIADPTAHDYHIDIEWMCDADDMKFLKRGIIHLTPEDAIAHAKAMLGIDPTKE